MSLVWHLPLRLYWLATQPSGSTCLHLYIIGITGVTTVPDVFIQVLNPECRVSRLHSKHLTIWVISSTPQIIFLCRPTYFFHKLYYHLWTNRVGVNLRLFWGKILWGINYFPYFLFCVTTERKVLRALAGQSSGILLAIHLWRGQTTSRVSCSQRSLGVGDLRNRELDEKRYVLSYVHGVLHSHRSSDMYRHGRKICLQRNDVLGVSIPGKLMNSGQMEFGGFIASEKTIQICLPRGWRGWKEMHCGKCPEALKSIKGIVGLGYAMKRWELEVQPPALTRAKHGSQRGLGGLSILARQDLQVGLRRRMWREVSSSEPWPSVETVLTSSF